MADVKGTFYHPETGEILNGIRSSLLSGDGRFEYPDPVPMAPPVNLPDHGRGMRELVQEMIRKEFSELAAAKEMETFDDADDFDIPDDPLPPPTDAELMALEGEARVRERRQAEAAPQSPAGEPGASGVQRPPPPATTSQATAAAPAEPIVKRSEREAVQDWLNEHEPELGARLNGTAAPGPEGS